MRARLRIGRTARRSALSHGRCILRLLTLWLEILTVTRRTSCRRSLQRVRPTVTGWSACFGVAVPASGAHRAARPEAPGTRIDVARTSLVRKMLPTTSHERRGSVRPIPSFSDAENWLALGAGALLLSARRISTLCDRRLPRGVIRASAVSTHHRPSAGRSPATPRPTVHVQPPAASAESMCESLCAWKCRSPIKVVITPGAAAHTDTPTTAHP
jgi:hypothetical protein